MKNYELGPDEVVLYKGNVTPVDSKGETQLILTNLNIVFITERKKFLAKDEVVVESYSVGEIKIYKNIPQVKANEDIVEIYLLTTEKEFKFPSTDEVQKFIHEVNELLIRKPLGTRCIKKVKDVIGDDGMRIIATVGTAVAAGAGAVVAAKVLHKENPKPKGNGSSFIRKIFNKGNKNPNKQEDKVLEIAKTAESEKIEIPETESEE